MKLQELFNDIKLDTQTYLQEDIVKRDRKYFVVKHIDGSHLLGAREEGFRSIENAVSEMMSLVNEAFGRLSFSTKQEKIRKFVKEWKEKHSTKSIKVEL